MPPRVSPMPRSPHNPAFLRLAESAKMLTNTSKQAVRMARGMATGKELTFGLEARAQMLVGVDKLADAVQVRGAAERSWVVGLFAPESRVPARNSLLGLEERHSGSCRSLFRRAPVPALPLLVHLCLI